MSITVCFMHNASFYAFIRLFQQFNNLPETGKVDDKTTEKMLAPRCGISDLDSLKRDGTVENYLFVYFSPTSENYLRF